MAQPFDLRQFLDLPPELVKAFEAAQFELAVERAARQHHQAEAEEKGALVEKLESQVADYRRTKFGPKSERLNSDQRKKKSKDKNPRKPRRPRTLPEGLPGSNA